MSCHVSGKAAIGSKGCIANVTAECFNSLKKQGKKYLTYPIHLHIILTTPKPEVI